MRPDNKCVLLFSGGRDSTLAAMRLSKVFKHLILITVLSEHLTGIEQVYLRITQLKELLPEGTEWFHIILPEFSNKETLVKATCLPCQRAYISIGVIIAQRFKISNLATGYSGYQNTWPEQTSYATAKLRNLLKDIGFALHLPVYDIKEKEDAENELIRLGLKPDSYEQKCLRQKYNVELEEDVLRVEIDRWIDGIHKNIGLKVPFPLDIRFHDKIENVTDLPSSWMLAFKEGDEACFKKILDKYEKPLINFIYRFTWDRREAEDLAQEVFLRIYSSRKKYKPKAKFSTYLYRIAANLCIDHKRKRRIKTVSLDSTGNTDEGEMTRETPDLTADSPEVLIEKKRHEKIIQSALLSLPANQRLALSLKVYESKSYREISKILGCSVSSVESLLFRARRNLKQKLSSIIR